MKIVYLDASSIGATPLDELSEKEPERYAALAGEMSGRFEKAQRRKKEAAAHERNKRIGKRRTNV